VPVFAFGESIAAPLKPDAVGCPFPALKPLALSVVVGAKPFAESSFASPLGGVLGFGESNPPDFPCAFVSNEGAADGAAPNGVAPIEPLFAGGGFDANSFVGCGWVGGGVNPPAPLDGPKPCDGTLLIGF
jgi:hypothetical protein